MVTPPGPWTISDIDVHFELFFVSISYKKHFFVFNIALHPKSPAMVMAGWSVHLTTLFPGQTLTSS